MSGDLAAGRDRCHHGPVSLPARSWFALNALVVLVALTIQIPITAGRVGGFFDTPAARVGNLFTFFTILSNILVAVVCVVLALRRGGSAPSGSDLFAVAWLDALLAITVTGIVYNTVLAGLYDLHGAEYLADRLFHTVSPLLFVIGAVLFGPRGLVRPRVVGLALVYPVAWLVFTLVRGALIGWYPYPFVDVIKLGYGRVAFNCVLITLLFLVLAAVAFGIDRARSRRAAPEPG
jgi:hypothetical protein